MLGYSGCEVALTSHAKGSRHQSEAAASEAAARATATPSSTSLFFGSKQASITDAEVMWPLKVANSHFSFKSTEDASLLFRRMFPGSLWRKQMPIADLCSLGLLHFKSLTSSNVLKQSDDIFLFDESQNHYVQSKLMDLHKRDNNMIKRINIYVNVYSFHHTIASHSFVSFKVIPYALEFFLFV